MSICQNKLHTKNITKSYDNKCIIKDINITLKENELVSLIGTSGIGKSTLLNILSGILHPDSGNVFLDGIDITGIAGHVSYMQQKDLLLPFKTIIDNVSLPFFIHGMDKKDAREKVNPYLEEFGLNGYENKYPSELSGGMRQRAALLRTYMCSSDVILLDEPFSGLDAITKSNMQKWYLNLSNTHNKSTIFITHDIDEAILLSNRIYIISGSPGIIVTELEICNKKEKDYEFTLSKEFLEYKREILAKIN